MIPPRSLAMHLSDAWFYLRHPVLFYREVWQCWPELRALRSGHAVLRA